MGVLLDAKLVKPTISLKNMVTDSKLSAVTACPCFSCSAMDLEIESGKL